MNTRLAFASLACGAAISAVPATAEIVLFGRDGFEGRSLTLRNSPNLRSEGFNDRASSAIVYGRNYEVCEDVRFEGRCAILSPGRYPDLRSMGISNNISSVRPLRSGVKYDRDRYAPPPYPAYDARRRGEERLYEAEVVAVREVHGRTEQRCWVERQPVAASSGVMPRSGNEIGGAVIGGILGGVLGHQVGSGRGNDLATGIGAVAGALAGANVARDREGGAVYTQDVRRCETAVNDRPAYYDVTYRFRGQEHRMQTTAPPPRFITVNGRGEPRVG
jgi:uncharacterized protein YcfJ